MVNKNDHIQKLKQNLKEESQENYRLKRELMRAKSQVRAQQKELSQLKKTDTKKVPSFFKTQIATRELINETSYFKYIILSIKSTRFYGIWEKIFLFFRRFRLFSRLIKIITSIVLIIGTSTLFLLIGTILAAFFAPLILAAGFVYIISIIQRKRENSELRAALFNKNVCVFTPSKETSFKNYSYFKFMVTDYAQRENCASIVVSPTFGQGQDFMGKNFISQADMSVKMFIL